MKKEYDFSNARQGAVIASPGKTRITIRIDDDVLQWFRDRAHELGGGSYQTLLNAALREYIAHERESLEDVFRRVLREELPVVSDGR
jgi:uncharacterized protein (DUF4415 family)